jgi:hypothetical protein
MSLLSLRLWESERFCFVLKSVSIVSPIAERLVLGMPTSAKRDGLASAKVVRVSLCVLDSQVTLHAKGTIVEHGDLDHSELLSVSKWSG